MEISLNWQKLNESEWQESRPGHPAGKRFAVDAASGDIIVSRQVLFTIIISIVVNESRSTASFFLLL